MARAVRFQMTRGDRSRDVPPVTSRGELDNPAGKIRAVAGKAAKRAAKKAGATGRKSAGKRAEERVRGKAKRAGADTPESMKTVVRTARRAAKTPTVAARPTKMLRKSV